MYSTCTNLNGHKFIKAGQLYSMLTPMDHIYINTSEYISNPIEIENLHPDTILHIEEISYIIDDDATYYGITEVVYRVTIFYNPMPKLK